MKNKNLRGFTLIELLIVIAIIGILASIVLVSLNAARAKAKSASFKAGISSLIPAFAMCEDDGLGINVPTNTGTGDFNTGTRSVCGGSSRYPVLIPKTCSSMTEITSDIDGSSNADGNFTFVANCNVGTGSVRANCTEAGCAYQEFGL